MLHSIAHVDNIRRPTVLRSFTRYYLSMRQVAADIYYRAEVRMSECLPRRYSLFDAIYVISFFAVLLAGCAPTR